MADSFTAFTNFQSEHPRADKRTVLVTGAAGRIGTYFSQQTQDRYKLRLMCFDHDDAPDQLVQAGEIVHGDVTDLKSVHAACRGIDTVLHLAGDPSPTATWDSLRRVNIEGTYNTMVAAKAAGCRRVVFASSIHAVSGYPVDRQVMADDPVNPGDLYGVSKCFGEAMGRYMAEQQGLSVIAVRICAFQPREKATEQDATALLDAFVSRRDLTQLLCRCIDDTRLKFAVVHGISDNQFKRLDLTDTRELLGYEPLDDALDLNEATHRLDLSHKLLGHDEESSPGESGIRIELDDLNAS